MNRITLSREPNAVGLDVKALISSRLLVQASSGGGKSYLLRVIAEQIAPHIHTIVIDREGEFHTLRERLDMALVGQGGEVEADPRSAGVLARRLVEKQIPAVVDVFELREGDRRRFVRLFLEALMAVPRRLYHPMIVIIDEAHVFCPERSAGESESTAAVIDLMSRGRKRGFCGILATQRLSKLHKDAAAECANILIGRTSPVDQKRAADLLGIPQSERSQFARLDTGEWFGFGPALSSADVERFRAVKAKTTHPKAGEHHRMSAPAPSAAIKNLIPELKDLTDRDPDDPLTLEEAQTIIARLKRDLRAKPKPEVDRSALDRAVSARDAHWRGVLQQVTKGIPTLEGVAAAAERLFEEIKLMDTKRSGLLAQFALDAAPPSSDLDHGNGADSSPLPRRVARVISHDTPTPERRGVRRASASIGAALPRAQRRILAALAPYHPSDRTKTQIALLAGYSSGGGGFNNALSALRNAEQGHLIEGRGDSIRITEAGLEALGDFEPMPSGMALFDHWKRRTDLIGKAPREILEVLIDVYPESLTKDQIAAATPSEYSPDGGGFNNALSRLRTLELIEGRGQMRASAIFFEE